MDNGQRKQFAIDQGLTPWPDVARMWAAMSGEVISHTRCRQIAVEAENKLRAVLADLASECGGAAI